MALSARRALTSLGHGGAGMGGRRLALSVPAPVDSSGLAEGGPATFGTHTSQTPSRGFTMQFN